MPFFNSRLLSDTVRPHTRTQIRGEFSSSNRDGKRNEFPEIPIKLFILLYDYRRTLHLCSDNNTFTFAVTVIVVYATFPISTSPPLRKCENEILHAPRERQKGSKRQHRYFTKSFHHLSRCSERRFYTTGSRCRVRFVALLTVSQGYRVLNARLVSD